MKLDFWNRRDCECSCAPVAPPPEPPKETERVCRMSPARLLANSLADPETRGEWKRERVTSPYGEVTKYRNDKRDLTVTRYFAFSLYSSGSIVSTPFTLNDAEKKIVRAALTAFDQRITDKREAAALARLTASPAKRGKAKA